MKKLIILYKIILFLHHIKIQLKITLVILIVKNYVNHLIKKIIKVKSKIMKLKKRRWI